MSEIGTQPFFTLLDEWPAASRPNGALASAVNLALTGGFVWLVAQGAHQFRLSPQALMVEAAGSACLALLCSVGAGAALRAMAPFHDREHFAADALRTAVTAVWLAPAAILLAHASPGALLAVVILTVRATRLLCQQWAEETDPEIERSPAPSRGLFSQLSDETRPASSSLGSSVPAAAAAQAGVCLLLVRHSLLGLMFGAIGAAMLTAIALSRSERERRRGTRKPALQIALNISLATLLTLAGLAAHVEYRGRSAAGGKGNAVSGRSGFAKFLVTIFDKPLARAGAPDGTSKEGQAMALGGVYPGVVLTPEIKPYTLLVAPRPQGIGWGAARNPFSIPFGGEYWMYRMPWLRPPPGSYFQKGTPAKQTFHTSDGLPLEMEARQSLDQFIDPGCCSEVQVVVLNAEPDARGVSLQLMLIDNEKRIWQDLGQREVLSRPRSKHSPVEETIGFPLISNALLRRFNELRIVFHRGPEAVDKSVRMAIDRFALVPR